MKNGITGASPGALWKVAFAILGILLFAGVVGQSSLRAGILSLWNRKAEVPVEARAKRIFAGLHKNVYRAFDYETEDEVYNALAQSVAGDLLDDIYEDIYQNLVSQEFGGSRCIVEKVEIMESRMLDSTPGKDNRCAQFRMFCNWRVSGSVEHLGHLHQRVNEYSAVYLLKLVEKKWKISDVEMREQNRIVEEE